MAYLILVRHGQSTYNEKGIWAGRTKDVPLTQLGHEEAKKAAETLRGIRIDVTYTTDLLRAQQTLDDIKNTLGLTNIPTIIATALDERDYGDLTGKNKWEMKEKYGDEAFLKLRRSWDYPIPNGETLKDVSNRVLPYYTQAILPQLREGKNVLIAAHGNSLRALIKYLDNISDDAISKFELATGAVYIYEIDPNGNVVGKEERVTRPNTA